MVREKAFFQDYGNAAKGHSRDPLYSANGSSQGKKDSLAFYTKEQGSFCFQKSASVTAHYVVVTEWITDPADETGYFRISSWGKEYYVNWKEYEALMYGHFLGTLLGNILYIR